MKIKKIKCKHNWEVKLDRVPKVYLKCKECNVESTEGEIASQESRLMQPLLQPLIRPMLREDILGKIKKETEGDLTAFNCESVEIVLTEYNLFEKFSEWFGVGTGAMLNGVQCLYIWDVENFLSGSKNWDEIL